MTNRYVETATSAAKIAPAAKVVAVSKFWYFFFMGFTAL